MDFIRVARTAKMLHNNTSPGDEGYYVTWYRVPEGTPFLPHMNVFTSSDWDDGVDPNGGECGEVKSTRQWSNGAYPVWGPNNMRDVFTDDDWLGITPLGPGVIYQSPWGPKCEGP